MFCKVQFWGNWASNSSMGHHWGHLERRWHDQQIHQQLRDISSPHSLQFDEVPSNNSPVQVQDPLHNRQQTRAHNGSEYSSIFQHVVKPENQNKRRFVLRYYWWYQRILFHVDFVPNKAYHTPDTLEIVNTSYDTLWILNNVEAAECANWQPLPYDE